MRLPHVSLPGPADVRDGAAALRDGAAALRDGAAALRDGVAALPDGVAAALDLVPRAAAAMTRVEGVLDRADAVTARADALVSRAEAVTVRADALVSRADGALTQAEAVAGAADVAMARSQRSIEVAEITVRDAGRAVEGASGLLNRLDSMLGTWEPLLRKLAPAARRFADSIDPAEVQAAISLVDRMPLVLDHLENDVLPMMRQLDRVGPDVHELLEVVEDLRRVVTGLPGIGLLRRRGEAEPPEIDGSLHDDGAAANARPRGR